MTYDQIFSLINLSVIPAWALLILLPRAGITRKLVHSALYPCLLGLFYFGGFLMTAFAGAGSSDVDFTTIEGVRAIFSTDIGVLIGWSHYLVFDLFVGAWIGRDALRRGVTHWLAAPSILLSFILGPAGLLLYMIGRYALTRTVTLQET